MIIKRLFAGLLAATLVVAVVPAGVAEAKATPTGKALPVAFAFDGKQSGSAHVTLYWDVASNKSEEYTFDGKIYFPKNAIVEGKSYDCDLGIAAAKEDFSDVCGTAETTMKFSVSSGQFKFGSNPDSYAAAEVGDYYLITVKSLPISAKSFYSRMDDKVVICPTLYFNGGEAASGKIFIDDIVVKAGGSKAYDNDFEMSGVFAAVGSGASTEDTDTKSVKFAAGKLDVKEKQIVKVGKTINLGAKTDPAGKITYKSSNKKVATVDSKGVVKGIKKGKAKITVTANGLKQVVTVTVK